MTARFMAALVIIDAVERDILPTLSPKPELIWDPTVALIKRVEAGEKADGIFAIDGPIQALLDDNLLDPATVVPVVTAAFGIAMAEDVTPPHFETSRDFIDLLLAVPRICYSKAGASGIYFDKLIDRLGIGDAIRAKSLVVPVGLTGEAVRDGKADLAVQQMSELLAVDGIGLPVPFPPEYQQVTQFSAAIFRDAQDRAGAEAVIAALTSPIAREAYLSRGLQVRF